MPSPDFRATPAPNPGLSTGPNPGPTPTSNAVPGPAPTQPVGRTTTPDGRIILSPGELNTGTFQYVGNLMSENGGGWGTGTLIGPRHILTAAHVCLELKKTGRNPVFTLPDGRKSEVIQMTINGGYISEPRTGLSITPQFDMAICLLRDPIGNKGYAKWATFDQSLVGNVMHLSGYDNDLSDNLDSKLIPRLIDRTGVVRYSTHARNATHGLGVPMGLATAFDGWRNDKPLTFGLGLLGTGASIVAGEVIDGYGWGSAMKVEKGASGGPLWYQKAGTKERFVVGVVSGKSVLDQERRGLPQGGYSTGSLITEGEGSQWIADFISKGK
jgi:hypothetical protein